ncbi:MAG: peptidoglycan-binding domain-containing protein [Solirubrobacteraceae bacterium]
MLVIIGFGALAVALLLSGREFGRRRRLASAASADEEAASAPPAIASTPVAPVPTPAPEPDPSPADPGHVSAVPDAAQPPQEAEIAVDRLPSSPERDEPAESEPPPIDPVRGEQVKKLQRQLRLLGFGPGPVDGRYGPQTTDAVKHLQEAAGLQPDGIVGPLTAEVLRRDAPEPPSDDRAERVKALQRQLGWLGFEPGPDDGRYGPLTAGAVRRFQEAHDLPVDGIVDRTTADLLRASVVQRPSSDRIDRVKALQRQLVWLGFDPGAIDGRYGPQTTEAVSRFQEDHDLPVSGIVDPPTQSALQQSVQRTEQW